MTTTLNINEIDVDVEETLSFVEFENDDLTGKILNTRQNSDLTPYQQFQKREELRKKQEEEEKTVLQKSFDVTKNVVSDVSRGVIEAPLQAVGGFADAVNETFNSPSFFSKSLTRFSNPWTKDWPFVSIASFKASGFVPKKLVGEKKSIICFVKKLIFFSSDFERPSILFTVSSIILDDVKYCCLIILK